MNAPRHDFREDEHFVHLLHHYRANPLAVFVGAGVSSSEIDMLGLGSWDRLLDEIVRVELGAEGVAALHRVRASTPNEPWDHAQWIVERVGIRVLRDRIALLVRRPGHFQAKYEKLLTGRFLSSAPTLRAISAFCAHLVGFSQGRDGACYGRAEPNRRVPAVVSTNYDPYLEAAASAMFRTPSQEYLLKPVGARGSSAGSLSQIPVLHVHGYVTPLGHGRARSRALEPMVAPVLTRDDYGSAWQDRAYSPTIGPQVHVLRHYSTLFVGFSFRDHWVNGLLEDLERERHDRDDRLYHYALVPRSLLAARGEKWFLAHGVRPVSWDEPQRIREILGELYRAGWRHDASRRGGVPLAELETGRGVPTGRMIVLTAEDADYCWDCLEKSRLGRLLRPPPGWPEKAVGVAP